MAINFYDHQKTAIEKLRSGSILCGGVGTGKSITAIGYYFLKECGGNLKINGKGEFSPMKHPKDLYIITTARKRDTLDWERECVPFLLTRERETSISGVKVVVDSWNNIHKYINVKDAFFIFDEQRVVGTGVWVKSFLKITKSNKWILLSATPGDTWMDYVPVFIANGFYKNRTEFIRRHVVYNRFTKYPKIDRYVETKYLEKIRNSIVIIMHYEKLTIPHDEEIFVSYDKEKFDEVSIKRWNVFENKPIKNINELCYTLRKIVNSDISRINAVRNIYKIKNKIIVFYNFNYELDLLKKLCEKNKIKYSEWNGHKHEPIPKDDKWIYLVQYAAGAEGWNCIETDTIVFYSQNYSYKIMKQSGGRIDRLNTPFRDLYYYHILSNSSIDKAIKKTLRNKTNFNESSYVKF